MKNAISLRMPNSFDKREWGALIWMEMVSMLLKEHQMN